MMASMVGTVRYWARRVILAMLDRLGVRGLMLGRSVVSWLGILSNSTDTGYEMRTWFQSEAGCVY